MWISTPYADITQIRFWGLRLSALSAPPSSGAPPSYSVVRLRVYAGRARHEEDHAPRGAWSSVDRYGWRRQAALRSSARLTGVTVFDGATSQPTTRIAKDANARNSIGALL